MKHLRHQLDHLSLGVALFLAGALFERLHEYHHQVRRERIERP